jgi:hypothetical protein
MSVSTPPSGELAFMYFPTHYRWSMGLLLALSGAPWGGAEIGEINRVGLALKDKVGDDDAWFRAWTATAEDVEAAGREKARAGHRLTAAAYLFRAAHYYHIGERFLQPKSDAGMAAYKRGVEAFRTAASLVEEPAGVADAAVGRGLDHLPAVVLRVAMEEPLEHVGDAGMAAMRAVDIVVIDRVGGEEPGEHGAVARLDRRGEAAQQPGESGVVHEPLLSLRAASRPWA